MLTEESNQLKHLEISTTPVGHQSNKYFWGMENAKKKIVYPIENSLPQNYSKNCFEVFWSRKKGILSQHLNLLLE